MFFQLPSCQERCFRGFLNFAGTCFGFVTFAKVEDAQAAASARLHIQPARNFAEFQRRTGLTHDDLCAHFAEQLEGSGPTDKLPADWLGFDLIACRIAPGAKQIVEARKKKEEERKVGRTSRSKALKDKNKKIRDATLTRDENM